MIRSTLATSLTVVAAAGAAVSTQSPGGGWPQHLGPGRNNVAACSIPASATLAVAWRRAIPSGSAGIVVAEGRAYTLGSDGEQDILLALDGATGQELWRQTLGPTHADALLGPGSTPVISGDNIIALGTSCQMQAINRHSRVVAWQLHFGERFKSPLVKRGGCNMSPLLMGTRIVFSTGAPDARLAAVDTTTGQTAWTAAVLPSYGGSPGILSDSIASNARRGRARHSTIPTSSRPTTSVTPTD